jgi:hypothetical protein
MLDQRVRMKWAFSKKFGRQMVNEVSKRFNIKGVTEHYWSSSVLPPHSSIYSKKKK